LHKLQPLHVAVIKPFKIAFCMYKDIWSMAHKDHAAHKDILTKWVSLSLKKAIS
jgi:hypothetical protein